MKRTTVSEYKHEWKTVEEVLANLEEVRHFNGWGIKSLAQVFGTDKEVYIAADKAWQRLKEAFNKEAKHYDPETNYSKLGSIGKVTEREVLRTSWWDTINGDELGDYDQITGIIEMLHNGEKLETGRIYFGS